VSTFGRLARYDLVELSALPHRRPRRVARDGAREQGRTERDPRDDAPESSGVFELSAEGSGLPRPEEVLDAVSGSGYDGVDLGPPGFLGSRSELRRRLEARKLDLAGG
jgi:hypothetical protein